MINLLLPEQKNNVKKEYFARIAIVFLISVFTTLILLLFLLIPAYLSLEDKEDATEEYLVNQSGTIVNDKENLNNIINDTNKKLSALKIEEGDGDLVVYRDIFKSIVDMRADVRINSITYQNNGVTTPIVMISGVSNTRENLQLFIKRLESQVLFSEVNAPVSNFVQDRNIEFSLEAILR